MEDVLALYTANPAASDSLRPAVRLDEKPVALYIVTHPEQSAARDPQGNLEWRYMARLQTTGLESMAIGNPCVAYRAAVVKSIVGGVAGKACSFSETQHHLPVG